MKKSVKNIAVILAALSLSSAFAATVSAKDIFVGPTTKAEKAVEVCTNKKVNCRDDFCGSPVFSAKNKGGLITCSDEDYCSSNIIAGGKFVADADAKKELDEYFKHNSKVFNVTKGESRFFCDGAYFYSDNDSVIECDKKTGKLFAKGVGKACVYVFTEGGVPFYRLDFNVCKNDKPAPKGVLKVVPEKKNIIPGDLVDFTVFTPDGKICTDAVLTITSGNHAAVFASNGDLYAAEPGTVVVHAESKSDPSVYGDCIINIREYRHAVYADKWFDCDEGIRVDKWCSDEVWEKNFFKPSGWIKCVDGTLLPVVKSIEIEKETADGTVVSDTKVIRVGSTSLDAVLDVDCSSGIVTRDEFGIVHPGYHFNDNKFFPKDFDFRYYALHLMIKSIVG